LDGPNVECHFNLRQDRISNDVFAIQSGQGILGGQPRLGTKHHGDEVYRNTW
jgi:hypothetical protein